MNRQTLPTFHAAGWTFPWSIVAVCGQTTCLRSMDYALIWQYLRNGTTNFCCAPTVCTLLLAHKDCIRLNQPVRVTVAAAPPSAALFKYDSCAPFLSSSDTDRITEPCSPRTLRQFMYMA